MVGVISRSPRSTDEWASTKGDVDIAPTKVSPCGGGDDPGTTCHVTPFRSRMGFDDGRCELSPTKVSSFVGGDAPGTACQIAPLRVDESTPTCYDSRPMDPLVTLITLGVSDLPRSVRIYRDGVG